MNRSTLPEFDTHSDPWTHTLAARNASLEQCYRQHRQALCRYVAHKFQLSASESEDLVHNAFVRVSVQPELPAAEGARAFLYRAVHNAAVDQLRRLKVRDSYVHSQQALACETNELGPERLAIGRQILELLTRALSGMPGKRRKLLMMHRLDGLSFAEIGRREQLSESVVRKHIAKALADCQRAMHEDTGIPS